MASMVHLGVKKTTQDVNINVKPISNINITTTGQSPTATSATSPPDIASARPLHESVAPGSVIYPDSNPYTIDEVEQLKNQVEVLKLYIEMLQNNPLVVNKYIIVDDEKLIHFIKLLTRADDVQIDADDIGQGCLSSKTYRKIHNVFVIINGQTLNLKYDFPKAMKELIDLKISTKYVW